MQYDMMMVEHQNVYSTLTIFYLKNFLLITILRYSNLLKLNTGMKVMYGHRRVMKAEYNELSPWERKNKK